MRARSKVLSVVLSFLLAFVFLSRVATAQQYPPPTPTDSEPTTTPTAEVDVCIGIEGEVDNEFVAGQAEEEGEVHVFGSAGAAGDNDTVNVYAEPGHTFIGSTEPFEDGSFSDTFTLPSGLEPGSYEVETDVPSCSDSAVLQVLSASGSGDGGGSDVLGNSQGDDGSNVLGSASDRGNLPTTGSNILDLVLLALALIAIGTLIRWVVKKRQAEGRVVGFSTKIWSPPALPAPAVPLLDTSGFEAFPAKRSAAIRSQKAEKSDPEPHSDWS